ncbi:MAG: hypothetical protein WCO66_04290 [Candidatus Absconditabacteria bacterium]
MRKLIQKAQNLKNGRTAGLSKLPGTTTLSISQKAQKLLNKAYGEYTKDVEKHISPIITLSDDDELCAKIANESYREYKLRNKTIASYILNEKLSTTDAAVYIDTTRQVCIIGFRGTLITNLQDLASDAQIVLDIQGIDPRVKNSLHTYDSCKREYEHFSFRVCGHSLGGTLSYIVAKHREPNKCVVFNPGVSVNTFFLQMIEDTIKKSIWTENTQTYKILGDIISTVAFVGHTKVFSIKSKDPLKLHAMDNFITHKDKVDKTTTKDTL